MALTASGQLSLSDIATEMSVSLSNVSLTTQSTTGINSNSPSKPDGSTPHAVSEFYSYDHSASPALTAFTVDENLYGDSEEACSSRGRGLVTWYHDGGLQTYPNTGDTVYTDSDGTTIPPDGFYWIETPLSVGTSFDVSSGIVGAKIPC